MRLLFFFFLDFGYICSIFNLVAVGKKKIGYFLILVS